MARFVSIAGAALSIGCGALLLAFACSRRDPARPNVLLLTLDTTRPDRLSCYGAKGAATPAIDRLAREGVVFERATTVAPLTLPAHASLMTGLLPREHGVRNNAAGYRLDDRVPTLAEAFRGAGYSTAAVVAAFVLDARFGLARGFDRYDGDFSAEPGQPLEDLERKAPAVADAAARLVAELEEPFFLWVHFYDPHAPYETAEARFASRPYDGEIASMDRGIARVLEAIGESRLGRTVTIAVGDHGEAFGEHGEEGHGHFLYEPTLRVPLVVRAPNAGAGAGAGVRVGERVSIADVAATALDLAGVPAGAIGGRSLAPLWRGERTERRGVVAETRMPFENHGWSALAAWIEGEWKWIDAPRPELYDLSADPGESADRSSSDADRARTLGSALAPYARDLHAPAPAARGDADSARGLEALGYVSGASRDESAAGPLADPKDTVGLFVLEERARAAKAARRLGEAQALYAELAERAPENARARNQLGALALSRRDAATAERAFREAIAIDADYVEALNNLGALLERTGRRDEAVTTYLRARTADPNDASVHHNLGALAAEAGDLETAEAEFREVVRCLPGSGDALVDLARVLEARGKSKEALELRRQAAARGR